MALTKAAMQHEADRAIDDARRLNPARRGEQRYSYTDKDGCVYAGTLPQIGEALISIYGVHRLTDNPEPYFADDVTGVRSIPRACTEWEWTTWAAGLEQRPQQHAAAALRKSDQRTVSTRKMDA